MSQVDHPTFALPVQMQGMPARWFAAMIGVTAVAGVTLTLALGGDTAATPAPSATSGPNEAHVAASLGARSSGPAAPDESRIAASVAGRQR